MGDERAEADGVFGARLKQARDDAGLSTLELAEKLFLTRESVDRYMRGERRPSRDLVERWEELCGLAPGSLVDDHSRLPPRRTPSGKGAPTAPAGPPVAEDLSPDTGRPQPPLVDDDSLGRESAAGRVLATAGPARRRALVWATILAAVAAGALGLFVGHSFNNSPNAPDQPESLASNRDLEVRIPASWLRTTPAVEHPDLGLSDAIVIAADSPRGAGVIVGTSNATGSTLLPPTTLRRLDRRPQQDVGERLGTLDAYRYADVRIRDFRGRTTLFVAPTSIGVLTLGCFTSAPATPAFRRRCRGIAQSVRLRRGRSYPLGPSASYQRALNSVLGQLNAARQHDRDALALARTHQGQAAIADRLGARFAVARARLADFDVSPRDLGAHRQLLRAMTAAVDAYIRVAGAARRGGRVRYNRAVRTVIDAEDRVKTAIRRLARLGYP